MTALELRAVSQARGELRTLRRRRPLSARLFTFQLEENHNEPQPGGGSTSCNIYIYTTQFPGIRSKSDFFTTSQQQPRLLSRPRRSRFPTKEKRESWRPNGFSFIIRLVIFSSSFVWLYLVLPLHLLVSIFFLVGFLSRLYSWLGSKSLNKGEKRELNLSRRGLKNPNTRWLTQPTDDGCEEKSHTKPVRQPLRGQCRSEFPTLQDEPIATDSSSSSTHTARERERGGGFMI